MAVIVKSFRMDELYHRSFFAFYFQARYSCHILSEIEKPAVFIEPFYFSGLVFCHISDRNSLLSGHIRRRNASELDTRPSFRIESRFIPSLLFDYKRLDEPIDRSASNHAGVFKLRTVRRSPQWNIVITRAEFQSNTAINEGLNNPDPSDKIEIL